MHKSICSAAATAALVLLSNHAVLGQAFIGNNFSGQGGATLGLEPPDTSGAPGIDHYVQFINGRFSIFAKNTGGGSISSVSSLTFWNNAGVTFGASDGRSDPRIFFDPTVNRWFVSEIDIVGNSLANPNNFLFAVSNSADPTQGFKGFKFAAASNFGDFDTMGVNGDGIYLSTNNFPLNASNTTPPVNTTIVSIPKADLLLAVPTVSHRTQFTAESLNNEGNVVQPAIHFGPSTGHEALLGMSNTSTTALQRTNMFNAQQQTAGAATLSGSTSITIPPAPNPPAAQQPGGTLDSIDDRLGQVIQVGTTLWTAQCTNIGGRAGVQWYKIDEPTGALLQTGQIADANYDFIDPSIAANPNGDVVIGYSRSGAGAGSFASACASVGSTSGGTVSFGSPIVLKQGVATYTGGRWGDYSSTYTDPADPGIFWTNQEWATTGSNNWATQMSEIVINSTGEARWKNPASGNFIDAANWFAGAAPNSGTHAIFSRSVGPGGAGYTVTMPAGTTTISRLSVRQGSLTLNLGGGTLSMPTNLAPIANVNIAEFDSTPTVAITNGTINTANSQIAAGSLSVATVSLTNATWINTTSLSIGGSLSNAGGTAILTLNSGNVLGGTMKIWNKGTFNYNGGSVSVTAIDVTGGVFQETANGSRLVTANVFTTSAGGIIDLNDNDLQAKASSYGAITAQIVSARNGGSWNGSGITSTAAKTNPSHITTLGTLTGTQYLSTGSNSFDGSPVANADILVKYTYYGDTDFNGKVDGGDYARTDTTFNNESTQGNIGGWFNGDFDYSGKVDGADYALIDLAFNGQTGTLRPMLGFLDGTDPNRSNMTGAALGMVLRHFDEFGEPYAAAVLASVPEPTALGALLIGGALTIRRRRR